jgi:glycosyltransferase involved in cell wall biosynthesis
MVITEHWSGYHYNFNISNVKKRKKIQKIFQLQLPVITVSDALLKDIINFSKADFPGYVIPNVIDTTIFKYVPYNRFSNNMNFLMVSQWKWPKDPFTVLKAWRKVLNIFPRAKLKIGGYGPQLHEMERLVEELHLQNRVSLIGRLTSEQIAYEMSKAEAFIHCSEYETFSVVCAEALCCGIPVIASNVGGISEYIHSYNGILVPENTPEVFSQSIINYVNNREKFEFKKIRDEAADKFSVEKAGKKYYSVLSEIILP